MCIIYTILKGGVIKRAVLQEHFDLIVKSCMAQVEKFLQGKILFYSCWSVERGLKGGLYFQQDCPCSFQPLESREPCPRCWGGWMLTQMSGGCCRCCDCPHRGFLFLAVTGCDTPGQGPLSLPALLTHAILCASHEAPAFLALQGLIFSVVFTACVGSQEWCDGKGEHLECHS